MIFKMRFSILQNYARRKKIQNLLHKCNNIYHITSNFTKRMTMHKRRKKVFSDLDDTIIVLLFLLLLINIVFNVWSILRQS